MIISAQVTALPPAKDEDSAWWWSDLESGNPRFPHCSDCGRTFFPPIDSCPYCAGQNIEAITVSGRGRVYSWVVIHAVVDPAFAGDVPYTVVAVTLDEGPRLMGRLLDECPDLGDGTVLELAPYRVDDIVLLGFRVPA